jgi:hypothetical protein
VIGRSVFRGGKIAENLREIRHALGPA